MNDFTLLLHIPYYQQEQYPQKIALASKKKQRWEGLSTQQFIQHIHQLSCGLIQTGITAGDHIAIISENRPEWNLFDIAAQQVQAVVVPLFPGLDEKEIQHILKDAEVRLVLVSNQELLTKVQAVKSQLPQLEMIYSFEPIKDTPYWKELLEQEAQEKELERRKSSVKPDDVATIVYTSGTTGEPKGVMLTHHNIVTNVKACKKLMPVSAGDKALSFLPLNHMFERMLSYVQMSSGLGIYYAENIDKIGDNLKEVQPQMFTTVPRLLEKVYEKIIKTGEAQPALKRAIFRWAVNLTERYEVREQSLGYRSLLKIADALVYTQWRKALGNQLTFILSGGATLNPKICRFFTAASMPILEGYGMTETSPVISVNHYEKEHRQIGTVGPPIEYVEVKIAEDGEILCKGPNVMKGYYKLEEKTSEIIDEEGWLHTGDVGKLLDGHFLKITDRKKSMIKTSTGKYVAPQHVEKKMKESFMIANLMIVGEGRKMITALIVPDFVNLKDWCAKQSIPWTSREAILQESEVQKLYDQEVEKHNAGLTHIEKIKRYRLVAEEWNTENGMLTPTQKVKRAVVQDKYAHLIEEMYAG